MLSYTARAFCSAAKSSCKFAIGSPLAAIYAAVKGTPLEFSGNTPSLCSVYCEPNPSFSNSSAVGLKYLTSESSALSNAATISSSVKSIYSPCSSQSKRTGKRSLELSIRTCHKI